MPVKSASRTLSLMRQDLNRERYTRPRPYKATRPLVWYTTEECLARPAYAAHGIARVAEHLLWRATIGRRKIPKELYVDVANLFFAAQEAVGFALVRGARRRKKFPPPEELRAKLRPVAAELARLLPIVSTCKKSVDKPPSSGV